jgi:RNA polymerase sigma-70 factor, ECF subfamily
MRIRVAGRAKGCSRAGVHATLRGPPSHSPTMPAEDTDRELVERFLVSGEDRAFRALFRRHAGPMFALAQRLLAGRDAEDAVQEAWVRAMRSIATFAWRSSLRTWLNGITVNCCREILRRRAPLVDCDEPECAPACGVPDPGARIDLDRALRSLPDGYRLVLVLHDVEGWTHREIATRLRIDPGTSKSQLARARRRLRELWHAAEPPGEEQRP